MLLLGAAAGAPFLPKLAEIARGNLAFAVGMMVLLMVASVGYLPLVLPLLLPEVSVDPAKIARSLVLLMLLPLGIGLAVNARHGSVATRVKPVRVDWRNSPPHMVPSIPYPVPSHATPSTSPSRSLSSMHAAIWAW